MAAEDKVGTLAAEAQKRKEKLKAFRKQQETKSSNQAEGKQPEAQALPKPVFRSYQPKDESLQENVLEPAQPGDVTSHVAEQLEQGKSKVVMEELDLMNLAPRKPDWDLKRDAAKKLEKLERRTQKAIAELIRERLQQGQDLVGAVNVTAQIYHDEED